MLLVYGGQECVEVRNGRDELDLVDGIEESRGAFPDQEVVFGEDDSQRHVGMVYTPGAAGAAGMPSCGRGTR